MEIKNLKKAAKRIQKAVEKKERIILYGDADLDGVSSVVILKETIKNLGGEVVAVYFPEREKDGYGINENALNILKDFAPALLITSDLGIGNFKEIKIAKEMGFEVIIIDHHEILNGLPEASIIVDPKQKGDRYPFKELANVGIVFKLSQILLNKNQSTKINFSARPSTQSVCSGFSDSLKNSFLELTALGTIGDMMPIIDDNKIFIEQGLESLKNTFRPGLKAFFELLKRDSEEKSILPRIVSALNISEGTNHVNESYLLLTSSTIENARELAKNLLEKSQKKQQRVREIAQEISRRTAQKQDPIVFEGDSLWQLNLLGAAASIICQEYQKPVFLFKKGAEESCGSVRNPKDVDGVDAMKGCADILITFGGHKRASGFRVKNENLEQFKECLIKYFTKK